jgi:predicted enzyme related to lactoylglutathione lyase
MATSDRQIHKAHEAPHQFNFPGAKIAADGTVFYELIGSSKLLYMETKNAKRPATGNSPKSTTDNSQKTKNLAKLSAGSNAVTWFEIPVRDINRATKFYETILDTKLVNQNPETGAEAMALFPRLKEGSMGRSDVVSGALVKSDKARPSKDGVVIYLNANPSLDKTLENVESAGGKIVLPRTKNPAGFVSIIIDSEGNKIGLFAGK